MNICVLKLGSIRAIVLMTLFIRVAGASEIVYTPINPMFGGNPNNGSVLMNMATAQNKSKAPSSALTPLQRFQNSLQQSILNAVLTGIKSSLIKDNGTLNDGTYVAGIYSISVKTDPTTNIVTITTTDTSTGAQVSFTVSDASLGTVTTPNQ